MGLKEFYYVVEDKYYAFIEWLAANGLNLKPLINAVESRGIPSLPLFTALFLIIIGGAYLFLNPGAFAGLNLPFGGGTVSIQVQTASGEPVQDALVSLSGIDVNQSISTGADGVAAFSGLQAGKRLRVSISKQGFMPYSGQFTVGSTIAPITLRAATSGQVVLLVKTAVDEPVARAQVSYVVSGETRNTITSSQGTAQLNTPVGSPVSLTVSAQGYDTVSGSFTPDSPGYQHTVTLEESTQVIPDFPPRQDCSRRVPTPEDPDCGTIDFTETVTVTVEVKNETNSPIEGATVVLFNYADQSIIGAAGATDENGAHVFEDVPAGISVYVAGEAEGYISKQSQARTTASSVTIPLTLQVVSNTTASNLSIQLSDNANTRAFTADVFVVEHGTNRILTHLRRQSARTRVAENLEIGKQVYVAVFSTEHVRYTSDSFPIVAGNNTWFANLTKKTTDNSVNLRVEVVDFYGERVQNANVSAVLENGHMLLPVEPAVGGSVELRNMPLVTMTIRATLGAFQGSENVTLDPTVTNVTVRLLPVTGVVRLIAQDGLNGNIIDGATYVVNYIYRNQIVEIARCEASDIQNGECVLNLWSGITYTVTAHASGYVDKVQQFVVQPSQPRNHAPVIVTMFSTSNDAILQGAPQVFEVKEDGATVDVSTYAEDPVTHLRSLQVGKTYYAYFNVRVQPNTLGTGVYLRLGDDSTSTANDNAVIFKGFPLSPPDLINSGDFVLRGATTYNPGSCGSAISANQVGTFKWMDAFKNTTDSPVSDVQIAIPFIVTKTTPGRLNLSYRAYTIFENGVYVRSPFDPVLGTQREATNRKECAAEVNKTTFKVVGLQDTIVQCGVQACLSLRFTQEGEHGGEGFQVRPAVVKDPRFPTPLNLEYSILDFNPNFDDGTELSFQSNREYLPIVVKGEQVPPTPSGKVAFEVKLSENKYTASSRTPERVTGSITTSPTLKTNPSFPISLAYGNKVSIQTSVNLVGIPQLVGELAPLPAHYVLRYDNGQLTLLTINGTRSTQATGIDFNVDPILPADAMLLLFNFSSASTEESSVFLDDSTECFELVEDARTALTLPEEYQAYTGKLLLLKYDASTDKCKLYSRNPNAMKLALNASMLRVVLHRTQTSIEIPLNVKTTVGGPTSLSTTPALYDTFPSEYHAVTLQENAWSEQGVPDFGVDASHLHIIYNNRQYSRDNYVRVYEGTREESATDYVVLDNAVVVPVQGLKPIATLEEAAPKLLGISSPPELLSVRESGTIAFILPNGTRLNVDIENQADSMEATRHQVLSVLRSTAFRRRQDCNPPRPCPFGMFPYSAFVDIQAKPIQYHLGGDVWTGKTGGGKADFEFYGLAGDKCDQRNEEGVYDYYWQYLIRPQDGNAQQDKKFKPIELGPLDYATFGCSNTQKLCGKLSFSGGQCINNCGDGWYYDAQPGLQSSLCSKNTFKLDDVRESTTDQELTILGKFVKNIPNAVASCFAQEIAASEVGCEVGSAYGPGGALVGSVLAGLAAGKAYDLTLGEYVDNALQGDDTEADVPGFAQFLYKWGEVCNYAGAALDIANAVHYLKSVDLVSKYQCPAALDNALSKCFCYGTGTANVLSEGCAAEKAARLFISSTAVRNARNRISEQTSSVTSAEQNFKNSRENLRTKLAQFKNIDVDTSVCGNNNCVVRELTNAKPTLTRALKNDPTDASSRMKLEIISEVEDTAVPAAIGAQDDYHEAVAQAKAQGLCATDSSNNDCVSQLQEANGELRLMDSAYNAVCGPVFAWAVGALVIEGIWADVPDRAYISINNEGNTNFDGGTLGFGGPDVDCADNTDLSRGNFDVWYDLDFSSLRVLEGKTAKCMEKEEIATFTEKNAVEPRDKQLTFYITSRNRG